jgi:hypothetical protein
VVVDGPPDRRDEGTRTEHVSDGVYSVANMITIVRLMMVPFFFTVLVIRNGRYGILAFVLFVVGVFLLGFTGNPTCSRPLFCWGPSPCRLPTWCSSTNASTSAGWGRPRWR